MTLDHATIDAWADDLHGGPVALVRRERLRAVDDADDPATPPIVFPPTFAFGDNHKGPPYALDTLSDGTRTVIVDTVGSQANRMEPIFRGHYNGAAPHNPLAALVPQLWIKFGNARAVSILDAGHRLGDAIVRASGLRDASVAAFADYRERGDATAIAKLAPTSLVFGAWDSRGEGAKLPRIVTGIVRAWDVEPLSRSAQYNPPLDYSALDVFSDEDRKKAEGDNKNPLAKRGFVHVPAVDSHGGVVVRGPIVRDLTLNLTALRQLGGDGDGTALRRYVLGLALVAATAPLDGFLRQGCLLVPDLANAAPWQIARRDGRRDEIPLTAEIAVDYARAAAGAFGVAPALTVAFSKDNARADLNEGDKGKKPGKGAAKAEVAA